VLRKLLCRDLQVPSGDLGIKAMAPLPSPPGATTRQRFETHAQNPLCSGCHDVIDGFGFAFEEYDQIGQTRSSENGQPIDASGTLVGTDVDGPYSNAAGMMGKLSTSADVARCFADFVVRFGSAQTSQAIEDTFALSWSELAGDQQASLVETAVAFVR